MRAALATLPDAPDRAAKRGHPQGRARLLAGGDRREHRAAACRRSRRRCTAVGRRCARVPSWSARRAPDAIEPKSPQAVAEERALLHRYATLFNARDWEALRRFIAEDCRLDLVSRPERRGPAVGEYFTRYAELRGLSRGPGRPRRRRRPAAGRRWPSSRAARPARARARSCCSTGATAASCRFATFATSRTSPTRWCTGAPCSALTPTKGRHHEERQRLRDRGRALAA